MPELRIRFSHFHASNTVLARPLQSAPVPIGRVQ